MIEINSRYRSYIRKNIVYDVHLVLHLFERLFSMGTTTLYLDAGIVQRVKAQIDLARECSSRSDHRIEREGVWSLLRGRVDRPQVSPIETMERNETSGKRKTANAT